MKKKLILVILLIVTVQVFAQKANTVVSGKLKGLEPGQWIYLQSFAGSEKDSVQHTNGKFRFDFFIPEGNGSFYILRIGKSLENLSSIYLEPGKLHIDSKTASLRDAQYSGGALAEYYNLYAEKQVVEGLAELSRQAAEARKNNEDEKLRQLMSAIEEKQAEQKKLDIAFVLKHRNSTAVVYPIYFSLRGRNNLDELETLLAQISPDSKNNLPIKQIEHSIRTEKLTGVGQTALPFSQTDTAGRTVSLSDFRGKYVLIDFWASWCVPCRVENPNVVAAFEQYKSKNFTVLGISFDNPGQHNRWMEAIHDDNLLWTQVSDLKGWKNEVGILYDIKSIPSNLLIDPNGIIVAKNLKGEKLQEKLFELLGAPRLDPGAFMIKGKVDNPGRAEWFHIHYADGKGQSFQERVRIFNGVFSYLGKLERPTIINAYFSKGNDEIAPSAENALRFEAASGVYTLTGSAEAPAAIVVKGGISNHETTLTGHIEGLDDSQIILRYLADGVQITDSLQTTGGRFTWTANLSEPQKVGIMFPRRYVEFYADGGQLQMEGHVDSLHLVRISGSKLHDESVAYQTSLEDLTSQRSKLYEQYGKVSQEEQRALEEKLDEIRLATRIRANDYIKRHPKSFFSINLVNERAMMGAYEDVKTVYDLLDPSLQQSLQGKMLGERLDVLKRSAIGATMLNFTQNDTDGKPVQFSQFKGKYVLVDFWASWCGPCRAENPNVLREYNKYKDRNFTVVGISLDDKAENWKKAIKEDGMPWTQLSDLAGWNNEVSAYYGIRGIPSTLLVGPDGKIIAKDLRSELLAKKLEEIFN